MRFVLLEFRVRIDQRVAIIETSHITNVQNAVLHSVNPAATIGPLIGWKAQRVRDATRRITVVRQLPKLLHAETVNLRLASFIETESLNQLLRQRAAHAFAQHRNLGQQINARLEVSLLLPFLVDPLVTGTHANDLIILAVEHLGAGKSRKDAY